MKYIKRVAIALISIVLIYFLLNIANFFYMFSNPLLEPNSKWYCEELQMMAECNEVGYPVFCHISTPEGDFLAEFGNIRNSMNLYMEDDECIISPVAEGSIRISFFKRRFYLKCNIVFDENIPSEVYSLFNENKGKTLMFKKVD